MLSSKTRLDPADTAAKLHDSERAGSFRLDWPHGYEIYKRVTVSLGKVLKGVQCIVRVRSGDLVQYKIRELTAERFIFEKKDGKLVKAKLRDVKELYVSVFTEGLNTNPDLAKAKISLMAGPAGTLWKLSPGKFSSGSPLR